MRRSPAGVVPILVLCCFFPFTGAAATAPPRGNEPALVTNPDRYDFGTILSGEIIQKKIRLRNAGTADLVILKLAFSCGCTIPEMVLSNGTRVIPAVEGKEGGKGGSVVLKPGEWADLTLLFQSLGRFGEVTHRMDIYSNDPDGQLRSIPIHAVVKQAFELDPPRLDFGMVDRNGAAERTVRVRSRVGPFRITGVKELPEYFSFSVERPGKEAGAGKKEGAPEAARLKIAYRGGAPVGLHSFRAAVGVENEKVHDFALFIAVQVVPPVIFRFQGRRIHEMFDLGLLDPGKGVEAELEIVNADLAVPYRIKSCSLRSRFASFMKTELVTVEAGVRYTVKLSVSPELHTRVLRGALLLESDHPDLPLAVIRFRGLYRKKTP